MQPKIRLTQFQLRKRRRPLPAEATSFVTLISNMNTVNSTLVDTPPRGGTPHMKEVGILIGNFELNP